ncbi:hypothetical protein ACFXPT_35940 [Streptomyces goshikiensis]|uniref:hypothetical protein n=1 Tax=Streptomyces goshikiensis TaxID=1942 RepID=UPI0036816142
MLTYYEVMTTDLGLLTTAADKWDSMAGELKKVETRYGDSVQKITMGQSWTGVSVGVAHTSFAATRYEYSAAQIQAKAVASLLRDAHGQFTDLKKRVESARDDAIKAGMTVSEQGKVAYDFAKLTAQERSAIHHDPDGETSIRTAVAKWQQHVNDCVKAVSEADQGVKIALEAVVVDSNKDAFGKGNDETLDGFNAGAQGDIEVYEARNAEDIATRINSGEKVSEADYAELNRSFRDNSSRPEFTQTFLNGMGAENTLKFTNKLNDHAYGHDKGNKQRYLDLQKGLANSLSNAMQDPKSDFYKNFRTQLNKAGLESYDLKQIGDSPNAISRDHGQKVRGYQSLVTLMQNGDGYSTPFLHDVASDIRKAEDKKQGGDPDIWDLNGDFGGNNKGWFANDPLDGVLGIMSKNPEASTSYFDPGPDGKNDNLQYLLKDRDWKFDDTPVWQGNFETNKDLESEAKDARTGLGLALEASTTGREPGMAAANYGHHSEAEARVMQQTISILDADGKGDTIADNLKAPLGRALVDYTADTHSILSGTSPGSPVGQDCITAHGDESSITSGKHSLLRVMRGVADGEVGTGPTGQPITAYDVMYESERRYSADYLTHAKPAGPGEAGNVVGDWDNRARHVGEVFGAMNAIGSDITLDDRDMKIGNMNDAARYGYHGFGGLITQFPVIGDPAQRMIDAATYEWSKDVAAEHEAMALKKESTDAAAGVGATNSLIDSFATGHGANGSVAHEHARGEAKQSYITGREDAYSALRTRK